METEVVTPKMLVERPRVLANSIPKSGTHLLLRLLTLLDLDLIDFGGMKPGPVDGRGGGRVDGVLRRLTGAREAGRFLGIGPHLVDSGRFPALRRILRTRGAEKVTVGVEFPQEIGRRWLEGRLRRVPQGGVVSAHCTYSPGFAEIVREQGMRVVCILRDPRDTALSHMHYLKNLPRHPAYRDYISLPNDHTRLMYSICGGDLGGYRLRSLEERYRGFMEWEKKGGALMVRFEDLVGPRGGGSEEAQHRAVMRVAEHVGVEVDSEGVRRISEGLFGAGRTFRRGRSGGWREEFSEEHVEAVKEVAGELLVDLGYEKDRKW